MVVAVVLAATVTGVALIAIERVEWPAYNSSNQLHALTTVGQVGCLAGLEASLRLDWSAGPTIVAAFILFLAVAGVVARFRAGEVM